MRQISRFLSVLASVTLSVCRCLTKADAEAAKDDQSAQKTAAAAATVQIEKRFTALLLVLMMMAEPAFAQRANDDGHPQQAWPSAGSQQIDVKRRSKLTPIGVQN